MKITFRLFANLRSYSPDEGGSGELDLTEGSTVGSVTDFLKIPAEIEKVILVNGSHAKEDTELSEGDVITYFPPMTGG